MSKISTINWVTYGYLPTTIIGVGFTIATLIAGCTVYDAESVRQDHDKDSGSRLRDAEGEGSTYLSDAEGTTGTDAASTTHADAASTTTADVGGPNVVECDKSHGDCDGDPNNGCETSLDTLDHCGACNTPCMLAACAGGVCSDVLCSGSNADCDGNSADCETNLAADVNNCGACAAACAFESETPHAAGLVCNDWRCAPSSCDPGFGDCDSDYRNGCETALSTALDCGACGRNCGLLLPQASATSCTAESACAVDVCNAGFGDCDDVDLNGCETDLYTVSDCGGCSNAGANEPCTELANVATSSCSAGVCVVDACAAEYADCDGLAANGCERNTVVDGTCSPDTNCTEATYGDNTYFFCTNASTWADAHDKCHFHTRGDLVRIDDLNENAFVQARLLAESWVGASDAGIEGLWRWSNNGVPFWRGSQTGAALLSQYTNWNSVQPDDNATVEDCAEISMDGTWQDKNCTQTHYFVCEISKDLCPSDPNKYDRGQCDCGTPDTDTDGDGFAPCNDACPNDAAKIALGLCGCGVADTNTDGDSRPDCNDACPTDPAKTAVGLCGCGVADTNTDGDSQPDCNETCDSDPNKVLPGLCGCGIADTNADGDSQPACNEQCDNDRYKLLPGLCGCGVADTNTDGDSQPDCSEQCDSDANKLVPGLCGCGVADTNTDGDSQPNCNETCDSDPNKLAPGLCGCGIADTNTDGDSQPDCNETCDSDPNKLAPGLCGCGVADTNTDGDSQPNCNETCDSDPNKLAPGLCGCGIADTNTDGDSQPDCNETCDNDANKLVPGLCGCGVADTNTDGDSQPDCNETCDNDPNKTAPGICGCGVVDVATDSDNDGWANCVDGCPTNASSHDATTGCGLGFVPGNIDVTALPTPPTASTTINCTTAYLNTSGNPPTFTCSGTNAPQLYVRTQADGTEVAVAVFLGLTVGSGKTLRIEGTRPAVLVVFGAANITGTIDASASGTTAYAGGNSSSCSAAGAGVGVTPTADWCSSSTPDESSGGGGGGFRTQGGLGAKGDDCTGSAAGGSVRGTAVLVPLLGGCQGGVGGRCGTGAGAGGGAVQVIVGGTLTLGGAIKANGGNGSDGCGDFLGGGGGGSGGAIRIEAQIKSGSGTIQVNGGKGGNSWWRSESGYSSGTCTGGSGSTSSSANGSNGAYLVGDDIPGDEPEWWGGGGGGGGYGRAVKCIGGTCVVCTNSTCT